MFCAVFVPPHSLLAFPLAALQSTVVVLESQAQHLFVPLIATVYWTWLVPIPLTTGIMRRGSLTLLVNRYLSIVDSSIEEDIPHKLKLIIRQYETNCLAAVEDMQS